MSNELLEQIAAFTKIATQTNERTVELQKQLTACRVLLGVQHCAVVALAASVQGSEQSQRALAKFQLLWNDLRGGIGSDRDTTDEERQEVQSHVDQIARALGGTIV